MSKSTVVCFIGAFLSVAALSDAVEVSVAAGVDVWSSMGVSSGESSADVDTDVGFSLDLEVVQPVSGVLRLGGGLDYLIPRSFEDADIDVSFLAGFLVVRWDAFGEASRFSLLGRVGYSTWQLENGTPGVSFDEKGGAYLALGVGFEISDHFGVEVIGSRLSGELEITEPGETFTDDIDYDVVSVRARYRF